MYLPLSTLLMARRASGTVARLLLAAWILNMWLFPMWGRSLSASRSAAALEGAVATMCEEGKSSYTCRSSGVKELLRSC